MTSHPAAKPFGLTALLLFLSSITVGCADFTPRERAVPDVMQDTHTPDLPDLIDAFDPVDDTLTAEVGPTPETAQDGDGEFNIVVVDPAQDEPMVLMDRLGLQLTFTVNPEFLGARSYQWMLNGKVLPSEFGAALEIEIQDLPIGTTNRVTAVVVTADNWAHSGAISFIVSLVE